MRGVKGVERLPPPFGPETEKGPLLKINLLYIQHVKRAQKLLYFYIKMQIVDHLFLYNSRFQNVKGEVPKNLLLEGEGVTECLSPKSLMVCSG